MYNGRDGVVTDSNGLIYMRARYYSPDMRRFINADIVAGSISNAVTLNRFAYANGNPVSFVDPFGLTADSRGNQGYSSDYYNRAQTLDEKLNHPEGPSEMEAAYMAEHIYNATKEDYNDYLGEEFGGWVLIDIKQHGLGLKMGVYAKTINGVTNYCIVYAGTNMDYTDDEADESIWINVADSIVDWGNNILQPAGLSIDMWGAINYAQKFENEHSASCITFIGHSKGGAEAAAAAVATNRDAMLFNPATLNVDAYGLRDEVEEYSANMTAYIVEGEILNNIFGGMSSPIDNIEMLPNQGGSAIYNHSSSAYIDALKEKGYK